MDSRILPADDVNLAGGPILPREQWAWNASYWALDWATTAMGYTLSRSLAPTKPVIDTEWHGITTERYRAEYGEIDASYTRAALWFGATQGLAGTEAWYWARNSPNPDACGKIMQGAATLADPSSFPWSVTALPGVLDAFLRTGVELSTLGNSVLGHAARTDRPVRILYSESSVIADELATSTVSLSAEALFFLLRGYPLGWVPESDLGVTGGTEGAMGIPLDVQILVVPGSSHVGHDAISAMREWVGSGAGRQLVLLGNGTTVLDAGSTVLRYDSQGTPRQDSELEWCLSTPGVTYAQFDMAGGARAMAAPASALANATAAWISSNSESVPSLVCEEVSRSTSGTVSSVRDYSSDTASPGKSSQGAKGQAPAPAHPAFGVYCGLTPAMQQGTQGTQGVAPVALV